MQIWGPETQRKAQHISPLYLSYQYIETYISVRAVPLQERAAAIVLVASMPPASGLKKPAWARDGLTCLALAGTMLAIALLWLPPIIWLRGGAGCASKPQ